MLNIIKADLFRISKDRIWLAAIILLLIVFTIPSVYTLRPAGGSSVYDQGFEFDIGEYVESRLPDYGVEYQGELTTEQYREIIFSLDGFKTDIDIIGGAHMPIFELIIILEVLLVTRDFSIHSIKNTLSSPISRKTYYFAKYTTIMMLSVLMLVAVNLSVWIANLIINGPERSSSFGLLLLITLLSLIPLLTFTTLIHAAAFLIRMSLPFSLTTICVALFASSFYINFALIFGGSGSKLVMVLKYFLSIMFSLITDTNEEDYVIYLITCLVICGILTAGSLTGGYLFFRKREVK